MEETLDTYEVEKPQTRDEIRQTVLECLDTVVGDDIAEVLKVTDSTRLFLDLQLGSIEVVALAEALSHHYPLGDAFAAWVSTLSLWAMAHLKIGDIVDFIDHGLR